MTVKIVDADVPQGSDQTFLARITGADAQPVTVASISAITYAVYRLTSSTPTTAVATGSLVVASTIYDVLQTDDLWTEDSLGYNFKTTMAYTIFATAGIYKVEFWFTPITAGQRFVSAFRLNCASDGRMYGP